METSNAGGSVNYNKSLVGGLTVAHWVEFYARDEIQQLAAEKLEVGKDVIRVQIKGFTPHRFGTMNTEQQILFIIILAIIPLPTSGGEMLTSQWWVRNEQSLDGILVDIEELWRV